VNVRSSFDNAPRPRKFVNNISQTTSKYFFSLEKKFWKSVKIFLDDRVNHGSIYQIYSFNICRNCRTARRQSNSLHLKIITMVEHKFLFFTVIYRSPMSFTVSSLQSERIVCVGNNTNDNLT